MTASYLFERDMLKFCGERGLDRIVRAVGDGRVILDGGVGGRVEYLLFELADGDIRNQLAKAEEINLAWTLQSLHHVTLGLFQLHKEQAAHQDLKPSNVLVFDGKESKVGDLGRAAVKGLTPPHDSYVVPGDRGYAPPELLYGAFSATPWVSDSWQQRRIGCDMYLLGSMVVFLFANASMSGLLFTELAPAQHFLTWRGTYAEVLPYLRDAFGRAVDLFSESVPATVRTDLTAVVKELCDPDPGLRGHPRDRRSVHNRYSVERYIGIFDRLAKRAEYARPSRQ
jgi:serine/threonine protein kinase